MKIFETIVVLLTGIGWPLVATYFLFYFRVPLRDFIENLEAFSFEAAGLKLSAQRQSALNSITRAQRAAKAAGRLSNQIIGGRAANRLVQRVVTPRTIRRVDGSTVLWVDDNPENNRFERQAFEGLGIAFVLATSTDEAIEEVGSEPFDAIISDMRRGSEQYAGYTLLERLRGDGDQTPFIIYSSSRSLQHRTEAKRRGAVDCTNSPTELFELLLSVLKH